MEGFSLEEIQQTHQQLATYVRETPSWEWKGEGKDSYIGRETEVCVKMELLQYGGSFKLRGALNVMLNLEQDALQRGVTAISAGNHAIAVSHAAQIMGTHAKVVMFQPVPQVRLEKCRSLGAEIEIVENATIGFERVQEIEREEGRTFIHPFEGYYTSMATATLGYEFYQQVGHLDMAILPIGGGGLASGMAAGIKACNPDCEIYGVEPVGANSMYVSFQSGKAETIGQTDTIASSLAPPFTTPFAYKLCRENIEKILLISDVEMCRAMDTLFTELKLAVEPAAAASLAGLMGPLKENGKGKRVGIITCGTNIDIETFYRLLKRAN